MRLSCAARTDPGLRRPSNEDGFCVRQDLGLFVVTDGMGGHVAGEVAARIALEQLEKFVDETTTTGLTSSWPLPVIPKIGRNGNRLNAGLLKANECITAEICNNADLQGMATTAVAVLLDDEPGAVAHVGDSRAYLHRGGLLSRLTRDHSWVEEQVRAGMLSSNAARDHPWRNVVTRAISGTPELDIEVTRLTLEVGDQLLLCSDGLTSVLQDAKIEELLNGGFALDVTCCEFVRLANDQGGPDNITVVLIYVDAL